MKHPTQLTLLFLLMLIHCSPVSAQYKISSCVFGSGSVDMAQEPYSMNSTLAQTAIGPVTRTSIAYVEFAGFWYTSDPVATTGITFVERIDAVPAAYTLQQNYPNPCIKATTIPFSLLTSGATALKVYDMLGKEVALLVEEDLSPGSYTAQWIPGQHVPAGAYIYRITITPGSRSGKAKPFVETRRMLLLR